MYPSLVFALEVLEFLGIGLLMLAVVIFLREIGTRMGPVSISSGAILCVIFYTLDWNPWVGIPLGTLWLLLIANPERNALQKKQEERAQTK